jgi:hypothetical protein
MLRTKSLLLPHVLNVPILHIREFEARYFEIKYIFKQQTKLNLLTEAIVCFSILEHFITLLNETGKRGGNMHLCLYILTFHKIFRSWARRVRRVPTAFTLSWETTSIFLKGTNKSIREQINWLKNF